MRLPLLVSVSCFLAPLLILADFSNDVQYISEECLPALHHEAIKGSLLVFAKRNNLTDEEMAERLLFIADPANGFTDSVGRSQTRAALGGISAFRNAINAIPALEHYIENPEYRSESLCALGYITKYDNHYFDVAQRLVSAGKLDESFFLGDLRAAIRCHNSGHFLLEEVSRLRMERILVTGKSVSFEDAVSADQFLCESVIDYTNSQEHILAETEIMDLLHQKFDQIVKNSYYRRTWGGGNLSDNEWYAMVTNACQTEIARA